MTSGMILAAKMRQPFVQFVIHVGDHASYPITRHDMLVIGKVDTVLIVNDGLPNESFVFVANQHITSLEPIDDCDTPIVV
jgi:hypothetical protein